MKKCMTILTICMALAMLCTCLVSCDLSDIFGAGKKDPDEMFADLTEKDSFEDGKPYHLYFLSNGDGTCSLRYITTDPANTQDYVIEIPETSPAGDTVTAIKIEHGSNPASSIADFPVVLTAPTMEALCKKAQASSMSAFDYNKFAAYFLKLSPANIGDAAAREELINAYPVAVYSDIYVFDMNASETERAKIYSYLTEYCGWNAEQYRQSVDEIIALAKQCYTREQAELCMTVMRNATFEQVSGITIPSTVTSVDFSLWADMNNLQSVTVDENNATIKMIDECLVDTATGTLELCLAKDGKIPENAGIVAVDAYAFACCEFEATELRIPEGVTEIKPNALAGLANEDTGAQFTVYLPVSLRTLGKVPGNPVYRYAGTQQEWNENVTLNGFGKHDYFYLYTTDVQEPIYVEVPKK